MLSENNRRIAKNTFMLYIRMLLTMGVSLFTIRIVLNTLGVEDYGIQNVVGGIVVMFSFLSNTMASASQRFFSFELGRKDSVKLSQTFSTTVTIYGILIVIILILAETLGLWFLNQKLVIPEDRLAAANYVYQFSILSFIVVILSIPYKASIISHENMKIYAYISIIEAILKLVIVFFLTWIPFDKLKLYAILLFITNLIITLSYRWIARRNYAECRYYFYWDKNLFKSLINYSGWNLFGASAGILNNQGINILLNLFFGPVVNAARGIAFQINNLVNQFVLNFFKAVQPQIIKYYASNERERMINLIFKGSKLSFFLLLLISMPVLHETEFLLSLWLTNPPEYTIIFTRLVVITALIDSLSYPLQTAAQATGKIKFYQIIVGGTLLLNLPLSFAFFKLGFAPESAFYISIGISSLCLFLRLLVLRSLINLPVNKYIKDVLMRTVSVFMFAYFLPFVSIPQFGQGLLQLIVNLIIIMLISGVGVFSLGLTMKEKHYYLGLFSRGFYRLLRVSNR